MEILVEYFALELDKNNNDRKINNARQKFYERKVVIIILHVFFTKQSRQDLQEIRKNELEISQRHVYQRHYLSNFTCIIIQLFKFTCLYKNNVK